MTREQYITDLIRAKGYNVKDFSEFIGIPYSTLRSILAGSIGGAGLDNVMKICKGLGITISDIEKTSLQKRIELSEHQEKVIAAYISQPEMQPAVDKLLGVEAENEGDASQEQCG